MGNLRAVVVPRVLMRVELHKRQLAVDRRVGAQQRKRNEMIPAERHQLTLARNDLPRLILDHPWRVLQPLVFKVAIPCVDHRHLREGIAPRRKLRIAVEDRRGAPYRGRAEACAGAVRCRAIERYAPHHHVRLPDVLAELTPHERRRASEGRFMRAAKERPAESVVDGCGIVAHRLTISCRAAPPASVTCWRRP